jgi:hypothetical protein
MADMDVKYSILGEQVRGLVWADVIAQLGSGITNFITARSNVQLERLEMRRQAQAMINKIRNEAIQAASNAAAVLSLASVNVGRGSPRLIMQQSLTEALKEERRISRSLI